MREMRSSLSDHPYILIMKDDGQRDISGGARRISGPVGKVIGPQCNSSQRCIQEGPVCSRCGLRADGPALPKRPT